MNDADNTEDRDLTTQQIAAAGPSHAAAGRDVRRYCSFFERRLAA